MKSQRDDDLDDRDETWMSLPTDSHRGPCSDHMLAMGCSLRFEQLELVNTTSDVSGAEMVNIAKFLSTH